MRDHDRLGEHLAGRHTDGDGAVIGGVQLVEHVVHGHSGDQLGNQRSIGGRHLIRAGDSGAHRRRGVGGEVELGDAAVAPHLRLG